MKKRIAWIMLVLFVLCMIGPHVLAEEENTRLILTEEMMDPVISQLFPLENHELTDGEEFVTESGHFYLTENDESTVTVTYVFDDDAYIQIKMEFNADNSLVDVFWDRQEEAEPLFVPFYQEDRITGEVTKSKYPRVPRVQIGKKSELVLFIRKEGSIKTETPETDLSEHDQTWKKEETDPNDVDVIGIIGGRWFIRPEETNEDGSIAAWSFESGGYRFTFVGIHSAWDNLETCVNITHAIALYMYNGGDI